MNREKRKDHRQPLKYPARIDAGDGQLRSCALRDVSRSGARILYAGADDIPDRFLLMLSEGSSAVRHCQVAWRGDGEIGVEFLKAPRVQTGRDIPPRLHAAFRRDGR
jgi:hypothetical protein